MPFIIAQAGTDLYMVSATGAIELLSLPVGVTLDADTTPRFAIMNEAVLMVNSPSKNLWINGDGTVRLMSIEGPTTAPTVAPGSGTGITGTIKVMYAFAILDANDIPILLSPFSPESAEVTLSDDDIDVSALEVSPNADVNGRVIVRNLSNGEVFYEALVITNNVATTATLDVPDAALPILPTETNAVNPPGTDGTDALELITEHKGHLWAKARAGSAAAGIDELLFSVYGEFSRWQIEDAFLAPPKGGDEFGITAFIGRRDELGVGRRKRLLKLIGDDLENFEIKEVVNGFGPCSQEANQIIRDVAYFLTMEDGCFSWGPDGVDSITEDDVHPWFTTDDYFNRARFPFAKSRVNPIGPCWELCLALAGSDVENAWVSYNITKKKWLGPHLSSAFVEISSAGEVYDEDQLVFCLLGGEDGFLRRQIRTLKNDDVVAIDYDIIGKFHGDSPSSKRQWLKPKVSVVPQPDGGTLQMIPVVGEIPAEGESPTEQAAIAIDLLIGDHPLLRYLGHGRYARMRFRSNTVDVRARLVGYELPYFDTGIRK